METYRGLGFLRHVLPEAIATDRLAMLVIVLMVVRMMAVVMVVLMVMMVAIR